MDDQALEVNYQISGLEISSDKLVPGDPINFKIAFNGRAEPSDISGIVSFAGTVYYDLDTGKYQIKPLGAQAELQGGRVGEKPAALTMASAIEIDLEKGMLAVRDLMVEGLGTTLEGNLTMDRFQTGSPLVDLDLDIQGQDLPLLMEMAGVFQKKESSLGSLGRQFQCKAPGIGQGCSGRQGCFGCQKIEPIPERLWAKGSCRPAQFHFHKSRSKGGFQKIADCSFVGKGWTVWNPEPKIFGPFNPGYRRPGKCQ